MMSKKRCLEFKKLGHTVNNMLKTIVIGLGVQGEKRKKNAGKDFVCSVDSHNPKSDYKNLEDVPLQDYDAALVCVPDDQKFKIIKFLIQNSKHVLVEKPLSFEKIDQFNYIQNLAKQKKLVCYTAYNHRFEPAFIKMKNLIDSKELGKIYSCRMFYGNGTARLVKNSPWRDNHDGVIGDLGSHLLDTINFWFDEKRDDLVLSSASSFENKSFDHAVINGEKLKPRISLEMTLCMWRNYFTCDLLAENGSAHIESLCKWGPSSFIHRKRVLPSGRPPEKIETLTQEDPTWAREYDYFKNRIMQKVDTDLSVDIWIKKTLDEIGKVS